MNRSNRLTDLIARYPLTVAWFLCAACVVLAVHFAEIQFR